MLRIVKASAGAGKTYTLTKEFLQRLSVARQEESLAPCLDGSEKQYGASLYAWTEILAVTFTNKAAAEMQQRVLRVLKERALGAAPGDVAPELDAATAARWLDILMRRLGNLNIRTIDSLLHHILRLGALELGLSPDVELELQPAELFNPLYARLVNAAAQEEDDEASLLLENAIDAWLNLEGCKRFLPATSFNGLVLQVFTLLLDSPAPYLAEKEPLHDTLVHEFAALQNACDAFRGQVANSDLKFSANFIKFLAKLDGLQLYGPASKLPDSVYASKPSLDDCLNKPSKGLASEALMTGYETFKAAWERYNTLSRPLRTAQLLAPLVALCNRLLLDMRPMMLGRGRVPMGMLPRLVSHLLRDAACINEALCRLGNRLSHLLLDEFQDTSRVQWAAIQPLVEEALSHGGSLFYVGDVKQAIYGWRGGDASLFEEIPRIKSIAEVLAAPPVSAPLPNNWRSSEDVVKFINRFFSQLEDPVLARDVAEAMLGDKAPEYAQEELAKLIGTVYSEAHQEVAPSKKGLRGFVHLEDIRGDDKDTLIAGVKERLRQILLEELGLKNEAPRVRQRDVAVLVRTNSQAGEVASWLLDWGVYVVTENSLMLDAHPLIRQIIAFLEFLDYPGNDLAFWEAISGPELFLDACGLEPPRLQEWLAGRDKRPLHLQFREAFPEIWQRFCAPLVNQAGFMSAYDILCDVVSRFSLLERHTEDTLFIRRLLETAHVAESQGALSLAAFLDLWNESGDEQKVPLPENLDAVRVLTIHKAKGLEFPFVIVPFHHADSPPGTDIIPWDDPELLNSLNLSSSSGTGDQGTAILTRLYEELGSAYYARALPQLLEQINLLYVSWTRAVRGLYCLITGTSTFEGKSPALRALRILLQEFGLHNDGDVASLGQPLAKLDLPQKNLAAQQPAPPPVTLEPVGERPMQWLPELKIFRSELKEERFAERLRGTLTHRCLEFLRTLTTPEQDVEAALRAGIRGFTDPHDPAVFAEENPELEADIRQALAWVRENETLAPLLTTAQSEQELLDTEGKIFRVDSLAHHGGGWVALEYKTGAKRPEHVTQLRGYLHLLAALPGAAAAPAPRGVLVYLDQHCTEEVLP